MVSKLPHNTLPVFSPRMRMCILMGLGVFNCRVKLLVWFIKNILLLFLNNIKYNETIINKTKIVSNLYFVNFPYIDTENKNSRKHYFCFSVIKLFNDSHIYILNLQNVKIFQWAFICVRAPDYCLLSTASDRRLAANALNRHKNTVY